MNVSNPAIALGRSAAIQSRVIGALMIRELKTRFGAHQLGYLYVILEPVLVTAIVAGINSYQSLPPLGMPPVPFFILGFITLRCFSMVVTRSEAAIRGNRFLLLHPVVKSLDLVIARTLLEAAISAIVMALLLSVVWAVGWGGPPHDLLRVIFAFGLAVALGLGIGLNIAAIAMFTSVFERLMGPLTLLCLIFSATFVSMAQLPPAIRETCLYNPITHVQEMLRTAYFPGFEHSYADPDYLARWIVLSLFFGLIAERLTRPRLWNDSAS